MRFENEENATAPFSCRSRTCGARQKCSGRARLNARNENFTQSGSLEKSILREKQIVLKSRKR